MLIVQVAGEACAIPVEMVQEIVPLPLLERPPGLPPALEGFLNLRGTVVPVLRTSRLFDLPERAPELYTPLVVLRGDSVPLALLVDRAEAVARTEAEWSPVARTNCFNDCVLGELAVAGRVVHLLSVERLFLEKERQCLAELTARAQARLAEWEAPVP